MESHVPQRAAQPSSIQFEPNRTRRTRGIRRPREEMAEIVELDSSAMKRNSHACFVLRGDDSACASAYGVPSYAMPSARKRQRTLAEQLQQLCLSGSMASSQTKDSYAPPKESTAPIGESASATTPTPWGGQSASTSAGAARSFDAFLDSFARWQMQYRGNQEPGTEPWSTAEGALSGDEPREDVNMDTASEQGEDDGEPRQDVISFIRRTPHAATAALQDLLSRCDLQSSDLERIYRACAERASMMDDPNAASTNDLVVFSPSSVPPGLGSLPWIVLEELLHHHQRQQKKQQQRARQSRAFVEEIQEQGAGPDEDMMVDAQGENDIEDMSTSSTRQPQLAGSLSHGEWFLCDEDEDSL